MEAKTIRVEQFLAVSTLGPPVPIYKVTYMVGEHGPFFLELRQAEFTLERVREEQEKVAKVLSAL